MVHEYRRTLIEPFEMSLLFSEEEKAKIHQARTLRDLDAIITVPLFGYKDTDDYYQKESAIKYIPHISVPYLMLNSLDDPLIPPHTIAYSECLSNANIIMAVTEYGGHNGWFEGLRSHNDHSYSEKLALDWILAILDEIKKLK